jgi:hypothetical protein
MKKNASVTARQPPSSVTQGLRVSLSITHKSMDPEVSSHPQNPNLEGTNPENLPTPCRPGKPPHQYRSRTSGRDC